MAAATETDSVATFVVAKWEGQLDVGRMHAAVNGEVEDAEDVPEPQNVHVEAQLAPTPAPAGLLP